jgi:hypothetical protein
MSGCLYVVDSVSQLYTLDPATASHRLVGPVGLSQVTDIAFHGPTLYGVGFNQFLRLDPRSGAGVAIGPIGFTTNGLAVASDSTVYAATTACTGSRSFAATSTEPRSQANSCASMRQPAVPL